MTLDLFATVQRESVPVTIQIVNCDDHARLHAEAVFVGLLNRREPVAVAAERVMLTSEYVTSDAKKIGWPKAQWLRVFDREFSRLVEGASQKAVA